MHPFTPLADPEAVVSILSRIALFGGVTEVQQQELLQRLETGTCARGQHVFQRGDEPSHIYIITRGRIELFIPDHEQVVEKKRLGVGECFGQVAVMSIHKHTISAVALEDTEFVVLSRRALWELHSRDVPLFALLMMNIARELARRLQYVDDLLLASIHSEAPAATISGH